MTIRLTTILLTMLLAALIAGGDQPDSKLTGMPKPVYAEDGSLLRPDSYEEWMHVGTSLGLGYSEEAASDPPGSFQNVYIQREAYAHYQSTGRFPEKTMLALAIHQRRQKQSIARQGFFQGDLTALELAVKDSSRFPDGWAYFDFGAKTRDSAQPLPKDRCFSCHQKSAGDDNVFVQFYPVLRGVKAR